MSQQLMSYLSSRKVKYKKTHSKKFLMSLSLNDFLFQILILSVSSQYLQRKLSNSNLKNKSFTTKKSFQKRYRFRDHHLMIVLQHLSRVRLPNILKYHLKMRSDLVSPPTHQKARNQIRVQCILIILTVMIPLNNQAAKLYLNHHLTIKVQKQIRLRVIELKS